MSKRNLQPFWKPQSPINQAKLILPPHIMVSVFTGKERTGWVNPDLTTVLMRLAYDPRLRVSYVPIHAIYPVSAARNTGVEKFFMPSDCELWVIFDNDVAPPPNIADAIVTMPKEADIAVLPYWVWLPSEQHTMPCFGQWEDGTMVLPDPSTLKPGWQEMGAGGTGAMFIRRRVFEQPDKLSKPFFKIISHETRGQIVSEDIFFTGRAAEAGMKTWVNTDFICSHYHTIDLAEVNQGAFRIIDRFVTVLREKYGDAGINVEGLIQELQPELKEAYKAKNSAMREFKTEDKKHEPLPMTEWK